MESMKQRHDFKNNEYQGYCIPPPPPPNEGSSTELSEPQPQEDGSLDVINDPKDSITSNDFFKRYISRRKPCILNGLPSQVSSVSCQDLLNVAGDKVRSKERERERERESTYFQEDIDGFGLRHFFCFCVCDSFQTNQRWYKSKNVHHVTIVLDKIVQKTNK